MASDEKKCWVCEQPINDDELTLVSTDGVRHECRDVCLQALLQQLAECRRLLREACEAWVDGSVAYPIPMGEIHRCPQLSKAWYERARAAAEGGSDGK